MYCLYIYIYRSTLLPYRERDAWYDKRPWCRDSEQPVYPTAPLFSETMLQTLENNSHHVVWFLRFCKIYHLQLRKSHSITLMDPWENGQALIFMQVRIKALPKETKGNTYAHKDLIKPPVFLWSFTLNFFIQNCLCLLNQNSNTFQIHLNTLRM